MIGQTIAHYEVTTKLGAGGMGEVYRARDTKLNREVALKVLPDAYAQDAQRMARFQREAQVLASLNHSSIAAIYGLEEGSAARPPAGPGAGQVQVLVMELVEGPTLAERIAQSAIPIEEALPIARQIAEALEYAHEHGIIHRDLKPANIKLTTDGKVKVLDFGLAKALADESAVPDISASPTLSMAATRAGLILGTAAYMSPEQAKGHAVDRRADIWAFGAVLFEMLTGRRAFPGDDATEILASVIKSEPHWDSLPASMPPQFRKLLRRCLEKDIRRRLQAIGEARIHLEEVADTSGTDATGIPAAIPPMPAWQRRLPWAVAMVAVVAAVLLLWRPWEGPRVPPTAVRLNMELGADASLFTPFGAGAALSADGKRLAFVASAAGKPPQLYVRSLDQLKAAVLSGTEVSRNPFFSPDGEWIAFFAGGKLKKVSVQGGAVVTLCDAADDRGGSWGEGDRIVFAQIPRQGLSRVSAAGGTPEALTEVDRRLGETTHRWPQVLPGGKAVLFTAHSSGGNFDNATVVVMALDTKHRKTIHRGGTYPRYLPSGHLLYLHEGTLFAAPFDLNRLEMTGSPVPAVEGVVANSGNGGAQFAFSDTGTLVYSPGRSSGEGWQIDWLNGAGKLTSLRSAKGAYYNPRFSPDGTRLAVDVFDGKGSDVHVFDWKRDTLSRLTFAADYDGRSVWTPDSRWIAFASERIGGIQNIYWNRSDGTGEPQRLAESSNAQRPMSWHPSGKMLAFQEQSPQTNWDIMILPMAGDEKSGWKPGQPTAFLKSSFFESAPAFSPDGRWLAYASDETATFEVYVRPFPGAEGKWQISSGGGGLPTWSPNGKELFYRSLENKIMVSTYSVSGSSFRADKPRPWSEVQLQEVGPNRNFDLHPDGKRFAVLRSAETQTEDKRDKVTVIQNFFEELRRIAPAGGKPRS